MAASASCSASSTLSMKMMMRPIQLVYSTLGNGNEEQINFRETMIATDQILPVRAAKNKIRNQWIDHFKTHEETQSTKVTPMWVILNGKVYSGNFVSKLQAAIAALDHQASTVAPNELAPAPVDWYFVHNCQNDKMPGTQDTKYTLLELIELSVIVVTNQI